MILIDSNIIIYSATEKYSFLRKLYEEDDTFVSNISRLEVLGFHKITTQQQKYFNSIFSFIEILPISEEIIDKAIELRKTYNQSIGDSIISATAIINKLTLYTNNEDDFKKITNLKVLNPLVKN